MQTITKLGNGLVAIDGVTYAAVPAHVMPVETEVESPVAEDVDVGNGNVTLAKIPKGSKIPLMRVRYTSLKGRTATYGVFWHGITDGEHTFGLRKLLKDNRTLHGFHKKFAPNFFVAAARCQVLG